VLNKTGQENYYCVFVEHVKGDSMLEALQALGDIVKKIVLNFGPKKGQPKT
jgi:hypothetical protein